MKNIKKSSKAKKLSIVEEKDSESSINIIDLILLDHKALKNCIKILKDEDAEKSEKLEAAKVFLQVLKSHAETEEKCLYAKLKNNKDMHFHILEGYEEHAVADAQAQLLQPKIEKTRSLTETLEAKMKVLAEIVEHHVKEEESDLLPLVRSEVSEKELLRLGALYLKDRNFTEDELNTLTHKVDLAEEIAQWRDSVTDLSLKFKERAEKYLESLRK